MHNSEVNHLPAVQAVLYRGIALSKITCMISQKTVKKTQYFSTNSQGQLLSALLSRELLGFWCHFPIEYTCINQSTPL